MKDQYLHISKAILQPCGIDISQYDEAFLGKSFQKRMAEKHCTSVEEYSALLEQSNSEKKILIDTVQNGYSEFFRNPLTYAALERIILPSVIYQKKGSNRKEFRIWSAACAKGQEAYSLAILLQEMKTGHEEKKVRIFATDQNADRIKAAEQGHYTEYDLSNLSLKRVQNWFIKKGNGFTVDPVLKKNIEFSVFDLLDSQMASPPSSIFGNFDLVICSNLLFYYKEEFRKNIIEKVTNCLADGGYLVTGETEREILMNNGYYEVFPQSAIFQKNMQYET